MTFSRTFILFIALQTFFVVGCGENEDTSTNDTDRTGFFTGTTDSKLISDKNASDATNDDYEPEYYTPENLADKWDGNLDYAGKSIDKKANRKYLVDSKGPGNSAIKAKIEQVGKPIIYVKNVSKLVGSKNIVKSVTLAKIKFKITIENKSKQDCSKASLKLYVYDNNNKRIIDKEQSYFFKDITAGKLLTKEITIDSFYARENKRTKSFDVNFSKVELYVTDTKFIFN